MSFQEPYQPTRVSRGLDGATVPKLGERDVNTLTCIRQSGSARAHAFMMQVSASTAVSHRRPLHSACGGGCSMQQPSEQLKQAGQPCSGRAPARGQGGRRLPAWPPSARWMPPWAPVMGPACAWCWAVSMLPCSPEGSPVLNAVKPAGRGVSERPCSPAWEIPGGDHPGNQDCIQGLAFHSIKTSAACPHTSTVCEPGHGCHRAL